MAAARLRLLLVAAAAAAATASAQQWTPVDWSSMACTYLQPSNLAGQALPPGKFSILSPTSFADGGAFIEEGHNGVPSLMTLIRCDLDVGFDFTAVRGSWSWRMPDPTGNAPEDNTPLDASHLWGDPVSGTHHGIFAFGAAADPGPFPRATDPAQPSDVKEAAYCHEPRATQRGSVLRWEFSQSGQFEQFIIENALFEVNDGFTSVGCLTDADCPGAVECIVPEQGYCAAIGVESLFGATGNCQTDADGDGIVDASDNCPLNPNVHQADEDGNGIGDSCELPGDAACAARADPSAAIGDDVLFDASKGRYLSQVCVDYGANVCGEPVTRSADAVIGGVPYFQFDPTDTMIVPQCDEAAP